MFVDPIHLQKKMQSILVIYLNKLRSWMKPSITFSSNSIGLRPKQTAKQYVSRSCHALLSKY